MADEDQGQWTGTRQHPRSAVRSRHSLEPPREMQWHHKDTASGDPGTGNHQALGNAGIKRYFRVREPRPRGGGGGSARSLCTRRRPPRNTLLRVACPARPPTPHRRRRARPPLAGALGLLSFWGAWSSLLFLLCPLGDADRTNGNRRDFEGLSTAATSEPDASRHGGNRADRSQRISERAESRGCRPQAPRVCAARLCRPPLSGARTGMVTGGVRRTACTRRPRALRRASFPVICGGRTAFPLRLLPRPSSHSQMMCLTFSEFSSADAQERDRDKSG